MTRSKIDGAKIADCKDNRDSFAELFGKQFPDNKMARCFLALTGYLSAAVSQVCSLASVMCMTVCGLPVSCPQCITVDLVLAHVCIKVVHYLHAIAFVIKCTDPVFICRSFYRLLIVQAKSQAERQASVVSKFQTQGLSSLTTDDVVIILEQVY